MTLDSNEDDENFWARFALWYNSLGPIVRGLLAAVYGSLVFATLLSIVQVTMVRMTYY
jgi:hypothetical protein